MVRTWEINWKKKKNKGNTKWNPQLHEHTHHKAQIKDENLKDISRARARTHTHIYKNIKNKEITRFKHLVKILLQFLNTAHVIPVFNTQSYSLSICTRTIKLNGSRISVEVVQQESCCILSQEPATKTIQ